MGLPPPYGMHSCEGQLEGPPLLPCIRCILQARHQHACEAHATHATRTNYARSQICIPACRAQLLVIRAVAKLLGGAGGTYTPSELAQALVDASSLVGGRQAHPALLALRPLPICVHHQVPQCAPTFDWLTGVEEAGTICVPPHPPPPAPLRRWRA